MGKYVDLNELEVYKLSRRLSQKAWLIYERLSWENKKIMGDQFIRSIDSVGANIAEGYRRYYYLDRVKFYYNSRASLAESCRHWLELLFERNIIRKDIFGEMKEIETVLSLKLENLIKTTYRAKFQ